MTNSATPPERSPGGWSCVEEGEGRGRRKGRVAPVVLGDIGNPKDKKEAASCHPTSQPATVLMCKASVALLTWGPFFP